MSKNVANDTSNVACSFENILWREQSISNIIYVFISNSMRARKYIFIQIILACVVHSYCKQNYIYKPFKTSIFKNMQWNEWFQLLQVVARVSTQVITFDESDLSLQTKMHLRKAWWSQFVNDHRFLHYESILFNIDWIWGWLYKWLWS